jgi:hypothetical protein
MVAFGGYFCGFGKRKNFRSYLLKMNLIAEVISVVVNPLVLAIAAAFALVLRVSNDVSYSFFWMLMSIIFAACAGIFVLYGVRKKMFSDFDVSKREERKPLFFFIGGISILFMLFIIFLHGPLILILTLGALLLGVVLDSIVNRRIKASVHLASYTSFALAMGVLYGGAFWILVYLTPIVAWSRITLKRHTLNETIVGTGLGGFIVIVLYIVVKYLVLAR